MGEISILGVLRLRAIEPPVCDRSAKRFAQDDGFVEVSRASNTAGWFCRKHEKIEKVTGSQNDGFVGVFTKNILNELALMGEGPL
jgi:hypothetical protein